MCKKFWIVSFIAILVFASCQNNPTDAAKPERKIEKAKPVKEKKTLQVTQKKSAPKPAKKNAAIVDKLKEPIASILILESKKPLKERRETILKVIEDAEKYLADPKYSDIAPELLVILGKSKTADFLGEKYYKKNIADFNYDKKTKKYYTKGLDFTKCMEKYPDSEMAHTAAFYLSILPAPPKNCAKNDFVCLFDDMIKHSEILFTKFPLSKSAAQKTHIINGKMEKAVISNKPKINKKNISEFVKLLNQYEKMAQKLSGKDYADTLYFLGRVGKRLGDDSFTKTMFQKFLDKFPENKRVDSVKRELKKLEGNKPTTNK